MKFTLHTSGSFYPDAAKREKLERLGFKFKHHNDVGFDGKPFGWMIDWDEPTIEFGSLEQLMAFVKEWGTVVIEDGRLEIYDNYRE